MAGAYPHEKGEKVYYVRLYGYSFMVKKLDANGKPIQRTNPATGLPIFTQSGEPEFIEQSFEFTKWKSRFTQDGYVSVYLVNKDTDPQTAAFLEASAKDRKSEIMDEEAFIKTVNPELWEKMESDRKLESLLGEKDGAIKNLNDEIARLKSKLGGNR